MVDARAVLAELRPAVEAAVHRWIGSSSGSSSDSLSSSSSSSSSLEVPTALDIVRQSSGFQADAAALHGSLEEPVRRVLGSGGKRWRAVLALLIGELLLQEEEEVEKVEEVKEEGEVVNGEKLGGAVRAARVRFVEDVAALAEIVHNGTLVLDDVEDDSDVRRGLPALHVSHGVDVAVNAGNFMYYLPLAVISAPREGVPDAVRLRCFELYATELSCVHAGQGVDIWWHGGRRFAGQQKKDQEQGGGAGEAAAAAEESEPTIEQYLHMCANKTGALARLAAKLAATACGARDEQVAALGRFAETLGVAFQIQDDILNITTGDGGSGTSQLAALKGGVGDDIHEGKRTIMVLHALEHAPRADADRLRALVNAHTSDKDEIAEAIAIMQAQGSIEFATRKAKELLEKAWAEVDASFVRDSLAKQRLHSLAAFLIDRDI